MENIWGFCTCLKRIYIKNCLFCNKGLYNVDIKLWVNVIFSIIIVIQVSSCLYRHDGGRSRKNWQLLLWRLFCRSSEKVASFSFCYKTPRCKGISNHYCLTVLEGPCFQHLIPFELTYLATAIFDIFIFGLSSLQPPTPSLYWVWRVDLVPLFLEIWHMQCL